MAAAEVVATSADEEVVCQGEKTARARSATILELCGEAVSHGPCRWTSEAVSLDNFGGMRGVAASLRGAWRELARVGNKTKPG